MIKLSLPEKLLLRLQESKILVYWDVPPKNRLQLPLSVHLRRPPSWLSCLMVAAAVQNIGCLLAIFLDFYSRGEAGEVTQASWHSFLGSWRELTKPEHCPFSSNRAVKPLTFWASNVEGKCGFAGAFDSWCFTLFFYVYFSSIALRSFLDFRLKFIQVRDGVLDMLSGCTNWLVLILTKRLAFVGQISLTSICIWFFFMIFYLKKNVVRLRP